MAWATLVWGAASMGLPLRVATLAALQEWGLREAAPFNPPSLCNLAWWVLQSPSSFALTLVPSSFALLGLQAPASPYVLLTSLIQVCVLSFLGSCLILAIQPGGLPAPYLAFPPLSRHSSEKPATQVLCRQ